VASDVSSRRPCQCACGARRGSDEAGAGRRARRPQKRAGAAGAQVCFAAEPTWLAFEWTDGAPAAMYITPHRDALAAAVLDAAQARRRPVARAPRPCAWLTSSVAGSFKPAPECGPALGRRAAVEAAALPCPALRGGADVGCAEVVEGTAVLVSLHAGAVPGGTRASAGAHGRRCPRGARSPSSRSTRSRATSSCPRARRPAWRRPRCRTRSSRSCAWRTWPARPRLGPLAPGARARFLPSCVHAVRPHVAAQHE